MAVFADTAQEEVDAACGDDLTLVLLALLLQIGGVAVEDVDVRGRHVDMVEEMLAHEGVIAFRVIFGDAHVFVHVERNDVAERHLARLIKAHQFLVGLHGRRAGGQSQYERTVGPGRLLLDPRDDVTGRPQAGFRVVLFDNQSHRILFGVKTFSRRPRWPGIRPCPTCRRGGRYSACAPRRAARIRANRCPGRARYPSATRGGRWRDVS